MKFKKALIPFALAFSVLVIILPSCRQAIDEQTSTIDTLSAVATDAQTVINSIKEKSYTVSGGYYYGKSPVYKSDSMTFFIECYFGPKSKLPELITQTVEIKNGKTAISNFLNQNNELFFASFHEKSANSVSENRGFYQTSKLRFADTKTAESDSAFAASKSRLLKKEEYSNYLLGIEDVTSYVNYLLSAYDMTGDFAFKADSVSEKDGACSLHTSVPAANFISVFNVLPQSTVLPEIQKVKGNFVTVNYHYEGQETVADSIAPLKK